MSSCVLEQADSQPASQLVLKCKRNVFFSSLGRQLDDKPGAGYRECEVRNDSEEIHSVLIQTAERTVMVGVQWALVDSGLAAILFKLTTRRSPFPPPSEISQTRKWLQVRHPRPTKRQLAAPPAALRHAPNASSLPKKGWTGSSSYFLCNCWSMRLTLYV